MLDTLTSFFLLPLTTRISATKRRDSDIAEYTGVVNKICTRFRYYFQSEQQFCCLVFVPDLQSEEYAHIRLTLLAGWIEIQTSTTLLTERRESTGLSNANVRSTLSKPICRFCCSYHLHRDWAFRRHRPKFFNMR